MKFVRFFLNSEPYVKTIGAYKEHHYAPQYSKENRHTEYVGDNDVYIYHLQHTEAEFILERWAPYGDDADLCNLSGTHFMKWKLSR